GVVTAQAKTSGVPSGEKLVRPERWTRVVGAVAFPSAMSMTGVGHDRSLAQPETGRSQVAPGALVRSDTLAVSWTGSSSSPTGLALVGMNLTPISTVSPPASVQGSGPGPNERSSSKGVPAGATRVAASMTSGRAPHE